MRLNADKRTELLDIIKDRHGKRLTLVYGQLPVSKWYVVIGDSTIADAILDRLINGSQLLDLK